MRRRQASLKSTLKLGLSALPVPRNEAVLAGPVAMDDEDDKPNKVSSYHAHFHFASFSHQLLFA
jgi:hypothetical protein